MAVVMEEKLCRRCGQVKPRREFHGNSTAPDGLQSWCAACAKEHRAPRPAPITCPGCGREAEPHRRRGGGYWNKCRPCHVTEYRKQWARDNRAKVCAYTLTWKDRYPERVRNTYLKTTYGITLDDFNEMLAQQRGNCAACIQPPKDGKPLNVDHCHKTGRVRGLLCSDCNWALGAIADDPGRAAGLIAYLDRGPNWLSVKVEVA